MKKFIFGLLITVIGLVFAALCFMYAAANPGVYNNTDGLLGALLCANLLLPCLASTLVMLCGVFLCWREAYHNK